MRLPRPPMRAGAEDALAASARALGLTRRSGCRPAPATTPQAMARLCPAAMLFVRCRGGISHNPAESVTAADAGLAVRALVGAIEALTRA